MSEFITSSGSPPIYSSIQNVENGQLDTSWSKFLNNLSNRVNSPDFYGRPSVLLNSDFNWNTGVPASISQADGNGAFFSEKWQMHGSGVATYVLTHTLYAATNEDNIGSGSYIRCQLTSFTGGDFYFYQRQPGNQFVRRYQNRNLTFSAKITNVANTAINLQFEYFLFHDPGSLSIKGKEFSLQPGINEISDTLITDFNTGSIFGGGAYAEFRLRVNSLNGVAGEMNLQYIKVEMAADVTILYVDHALERTRINNS